MKDDRKIEPEKINIVKLRAIKGSIDTTAAVKNEEGNYSFSFELEHAIKAEEKVVGLLLSVTIEAVDSDKMPIGVHAAFTHELVFEIDNLDDFLDFSEGSSEPIIDRIMLGTLIGIAYSTIRGIIYTRTQATSITGGILLPVIDPKKLISDNNNEKKDENS
ncbi:MAG: hypothetical protein J0I41_16495 [Filimonas sp.]|nr:hypothetical protein [Filimonas sp.]